MGRASSLALVISFSPVTGALSRVHLGEEETEDSLSVFPVEVRQLNGDLLLLCLLLHEPVLVLFLRWVLIGLFLLEFSSLFFFDLLHGFEEELLDVRSLVKDHLS